MGHQQCPPQSAHALRSPASTHSPVPLALPSGLQALLLSASSLAPGERVVTGLVYGLSCFAFQILLGSFVLVLLLGPFFGERW